MNLIIEFITNFFESIKKRAKKNYLLSVILKYLNKIKKPRMLLKRQQKKHDVMIKKFIKKSHTINQKLINGNFNNFFTEIGNETC